MSLYLLYSDPHLSDKPPSSCTESYLDDMLDLLRQTVRLARERKVIAVVIAGDVFHSKAPGRVSHRLLMLLIEIIRSYGVPVFIVPGNHDVRNDRLDSIRETQPLGVLYQAGALYLDGWGGYDAGHQYRVYGVPWQQDWERLEEQLTGYREVVTDWRQLPPEERGTVGVHHLVVAHAPLYPPGQELPYEFYPAGEWARFMGRDGFCFYGHVHEPHGVWSFNGVTFCNNGALSRGSLHEYNLTRQVGCTLWDDETGQFEFVPLDAKPASEVFRLVEKQQITDMQGRLDSFLADIGSTTLDVLSPATVLEHVRSLGLDKAATDLVEDLLAFAEGKK